MRTWGCQLALLQRLLSSLGIPRKAIANQVGNFLLTEEDCERLCRRRSSAALGTNSGKQRVECLCASLWSGGPVSKGRSSAFQIPCRTNSYIHCQTSSLRDPVPCSAIPTMSHSACRTSVLPLQLPPPCDPSGICPRKTVNRRANEQIDIRRAIREEKRMRSDWSWTRWLKQRRAGGSIIYPLPVKMSTRPCQVYRFDLFFNSAHVYVSEV